MMPTSSLFHWVCQKETSSTSPLPSFNFSIPYEAMRVKRESTYVSSYAEHPVQSAIFNFDFSKDGSLLAAVSKDKRVIVFDSLNQAAITVQENAHADCINGVRFYAGTDRNRIVTCSDDSTIKLWDLRKSCECTDVLKAHTYHVKNANYMGGYIISSSFDGLVLAWDLESYQHEREPILLLKVANIVRTAVSSEHRKIIITTLAGYMIVIHDCHIPTLPEDLVGFDPTQPYLSEPHVFSPLRKHNRVDIIQDFLPSNEDVSHVFSAQLSPRGDCVVVRYYATDIQTADHEFTTVHFLHQTKDADEDSDQCSSGLCPPSSLPPAHSSQPSANSTDTGGTASSSLGTSSATVNNPIDMSHEAAVNASQAGAEGVSEDCACAESSSPSQQVMDKRTYNQLAMRGRRSLHYYIEEPNMRRGIIKEVSFSGDGRVIASPYAHGVRLLGYDAQCSEFIAQPQPTLLTEIKTLYSHNNLTLTTKISPDNTLLVTGCNNGIVCFHSPAF